GRYRTNVWDYAGISSIGASRSEELAMHPTVKPVALIADAIRDCSRRGEIVLDGFGGSGRCAAQREVNDFAERYHAAQTDKEKQLWLDEWHFEQRMFDIINDAMSDRYKARLENRSYHAVASREGQTMAEFIEDRKRPKGLRKW